MGKMAVLRLKKGRDKSMLNRHPWIFSGAIQSVDGTPAEGDVVEVKDAEGKFIGKGHYYQGSITVRLLTFENEAIDVEFWKSRISAARLFRERTLSLNCPETNAYRLVHGEGDQLPGLIIDRYDSALVVETHTSGMSRALGEIKTALDYIYGDLIKTIFVRDIDSESRSWVKGDAPSTVIRENGFEFEVNWKEGQKTGFFLDQRENRKLLQHYSKDRTVLNTFSYTGGFSVYALGAGARRVVSVDSSKSAIAGAEGNIKRNAGGDRHQSVVSDFKNYMKEIPEKFDVIVLDPPAFAKNRGAVTDAARAYQRINELALAHLPDGGVLFTFSCSQAVDRDLFRKIVFSAAAHVGRPVRILHQLTQPADHPVSIFHPEGEYLKGLVLAVG